jgi:hypothetical protein
VFAWLDGLIEQTYPSPPVLVGQVLTILSTTVLLKRLTATTH